MRKFLVAALATSALGITAPHAYAADSSFFAGGCYGVFDGINITAVVGVVAVYSTEAAENPVTATFTCTYRIVNTGATVTHSATADPVGAMEFGVQYAPQPGDDIQICTTVDYTSNSDATDTTCRVPIDPFDASGGLLDVIAGLTQVVDPLLCPRLANLAPGVPGVVDIDGTGDVSVAGERIWDCPPYGD